MTQEDRRQLARGFWVTSAGTLASRVLGLARDIATARLLGLGVVADALVIAFRIPNLFRRLFGEGALAVGLVPVLAEHLERDRMSAWRLASVVMTWLVAALAVVVLVGEAICGAAWLAAGSSSDARLLVVLSAVLLPYTVLGCLAAQVSATLQADGHFRAGAFAPVVMNVFWLVGAWWIAPAVATDERQQALILALCILVGGAAQVVVQWPALRRIGFRFSYAWQESREGALRVGRAMAPLAAGYAVTQVNTLVDSLIAWCLSAEEGGRRTIAWLGDAVEYPLQHGAASAVYYGERLYQFPLGMIGLAVATVIFPLLSRHAARGRRDEVARDLETGLALVWFMALPAGLGLMLLAEPIARVLFERDQFLPADTARAARMIFWYSTAVWAYCAQPVLVRGYVALGDRITPVKVAVAAVLLNFVLNVSLVWPLAERGLAISTAVSAVVQVGWLGAFFSRRLARLDWSRLARSAAKTLLASAAMVLVVVALDAAGPHGGKSADLIRTVLAIAGGIAVYCGVAHLLRHAELRFLIGRGS